MAFPKQQSIYLRVYRYKPEGNRLFRACRRQGAAPRPNGPFRKAMARRGADAACRRRGRPTQGVRPPAVVGAGRSAVDVVGKSVENSLFEQTSCVTHNRPHGPLFRPILEREENSSERGRTWLAGSRKGARPSRDPGQPSAGPPPVPAARPPLQGSPIGHLPHPKNQRPEPYRPRRRPGHKDALSKKGQVERDAAPKMRRREKKEGARCAQNHVKKEGGAPGRLAREALRRHEPRARALLGPHGRPRRGGRRLLVPRRDRVR